MECILLVHKNGILTTPEREVSQSNNRFPAEYAMQGWRDTEKYSNALAMLGAHGSSASWLLVREVQPFISVALHRPGPIKGQSPYTLLRWRTRADVSALLESTEELW